MRILRLHQSEDWLNVLKRSARHDFYHLPGYHALAEQEGQGTACLLVWESAEHMVALPLLLRSLTGVPGCEELGPGAMDATSVYGYAGPVASKPNLSESELNAFRTALREALTGLGVIAVFSRLHPLIAQAGLLANIGELKSLGQTVSIDLTLSLDEQWRQFRSDHRRGIKKLQQSGLVCLHDTELRYLDDFITVYHETMHRVGAQAEYFFDRDYFCQLFQQLSTDAHLFIVLSDGRVVSGGIVVKRNGIIQYHLGGTHASHLKLAPIKLMFETVRRWGAQSGATVFHLGGGVGSQEDSLFYFKSGFSNRRHSFVCWRWIVAPEAYKLLCDSGSAGHALNGSTWASDEYFPLYRSPAVPATPSLASH